MFSVSHRFRLRFGGVLRGRFVSRTWFDRVPAGTVLAGTRLFRTRSDYKKWCEPGTCSRPRTCFENMFPLELYRELVWTPGGCSLSLIWREAWNLHPLNGVNFYGQLLIHTLAQNVYWNQNKYSKDKICPRFENLPLKRIDYNWIMYKEMGDGIYASKILQIVYYLHSKYEHYQIIM